MATDRRTTGLPRPTGLPRLVVLAGRLATAGLTAAMAVIHLHLWSTGYRHVHIIGVLFLLNGIGGLVLTAGVLVAPTRVLAGVTALVTGFTAGTLGALVLSMTTGLFGFQEFAGAPFLTDTIWVESAGTVVAAALTVALAAVPLRSRRTARHRSLAAPVPAR